MNNRGQILFFAFMLVLTLIVLALALSGPLRELIGDARDSNSMDCENASISSFDKGACLVSDLTLFHYVGGIIFLVGAIMAARAIR